MPGKYGVLGGRALARASDTDLYNFAINYAQAHAMGTPQGVVGAGVDTGLAAFPRSTRLELGRQSGPDAVARRKALALSLARRTTEASRQRVLNRLLGGYGLAV